MISIIVAASTNNVIGAQGELPWRLSDDLRHFKSVTMDKPIIMGRKTWESIGKALPGRQNIVVTRQSGHKAQGCDVVSSLQDAVSLAGDAEEVMVIGGSQIYELALPMAHRLYLTRVHAEVEGDAYFPTLDENDWQCVSNELHAADDRNEFDFSFMVYERTESYIGDT